MKVFVDADPIVYRSGFAAQGYAYQVVAEDQSGKLYERTFTPKDGESHSAMIGDWLTRYKLTELSRDKIVLPEPVSHVLYLVKNELAGIESAVKQRYKGKDKLHVRTFLSGPNNFRCGIAKQRPYKGNRDPLHKPFHYQAIRDYIVERGGNVIHGREADDEVSILAHVARRAGEPYIIATIDKDLDQIPGTHYDYRQKVFYEVDEHDAKRWFWVQVLAGDSTDNVPGCWKVGPSKAMHVVDKIYEEFGDNTIEMWRAVLLTYGASVAVAGCPYTAEQVWDVAVETARLVYMQQRPGELWNPPGVPMGTIETGVNIDD